MPDIFPDFNQTWNFVTGFHKGSQYQFSRTSVQWDPRWFMWMDGRTRQSQQALFVTMRTLLKITKTPNFLFRCDDSYRFLWRYVSR